METVSTDPHCPYCWRIQPPEEVDIWRCPSCNLFVRRHDLVLGDDPGPGLNDQVRHFCPWCAYPVAWEYSLPEGEEFVCPGCAGTLSEDILQTQHAINHYRKRGLNGTGYLVFAVVLITIIALTILAVTNG